MLYRNVNMKNIIVLSDGTGQKGGVGSNTNVYKLFNMIEDRTKKQIAYYDSGLGTDWRKISGSIVGRGFSENILECYRFIFDNFEAQDKIFLFGFSRGAATVRSLSAFIHLFGVLPKSRPDLIKQAFKIYKIRNDKERNLQASAFIRKHHTMWCKIEFLGVWDTVAALGIPISWLSLLADHILPYRFHSFKLSESVIYARQALSIDEERKAFHPILWETFEIEPYKDKIKQVWFCGVHTDVGGGYEDDDLSNISLKWMVNEATARGLIIYPLSQAFINIENAIMNENGFMHNEQKGFVGKFFRKEQRKWNKSKQGEPHIHSSVLKRTKNAYNKDNPRYSPWILSYTDKNLPYIVN